MPSHSQAFDTRHSRSSASSTAGQKPGKGTDCGTSPTTQTIGVVQNLVSGSLYNVDVNIAGVSSGGAAGSVVLAPGSSQTIQGTAPTVPALVMKAPASAGSTQVIAQMVDNTGANAFNCQQNDTCQVGSGILLMDFFRSLI